MYRDNRSKEGTVKARIEGRESGKEKQDRTKERERENEKKRLGLLLYRKKTDFQASGTEQRTREE
jgi:hypothetical protein